MDICSYTEKGATKMRMITLHLPEADLTTLNKMVEKKLYANRSDAIRHAIKDLIRYHMEFTSFRKELQKK